MIATLGVDDLARVLNEELENQIIWAYFKTWKPKSRSHLPEEFRVLQLPSKLDPQVAVRLQNLLEYSHTEVRPFNNSRSRSSCTSRVEDLEVGKVGAE